MVQDETGLRLRAYDGVASDRGNTSAADGAKGLLPTGKWASARFGRFTDWTFGERFWYGGEPRANTTRLPPRHPARAGSRP